MIETTGLSLFCSQKAPFLPLLTYSSNVFQSTEKGKNPNSYLHYKAERVSQIEYVTVIWLIHIASTVNFHLFQPSLVTVHPILLLPINAFHNVSI